MAADGKEITQLCGCDCVAESPHGQARTNLCWGPHRSHAYYKLLTKRQCWSRDTISRNGVDTPLHLNVRELPLSLNRLITGSKSPVHKYPEYQALTIAIWIKVNCAASSSVFTLLCHNIQQMELTGFNDSGQRKINSLASRYGYKS
jgi:hypothetical protein